MPARPERHAMSRAKLKWMGAVCALAVAVAGLAGAGSWAGAGGAVAAPNRVVVPTPRGGPPPGPPPTPRPRRDTGPAGPGAPGGGPIPTATPGAGVVQPTPPQRTPQAPPPEPTRERLAPSGTLSTYADPNLGFSFRYPANWYLQAPGRQAVAPPDAYGLTLTNYDPAVAVKRPPTAEEVQAGITIHLGMRTDITKYRSLDDWIA